MKKYEYLPHTADAKFRAYGKTLEEAFKNAALAMANITFTSAEIKPKIKKEIKIKASSLKELILTFLDEFVFLQDTEGFLLHDFDSISISQKKSFALQAKVTGDHYKNYEMQGQVVKAVTYNNMVIEEKKGKCMTQIVVDI